MILATIFETSTLHISKKRYTIASLSKETSERVYIGVELMAPVSALYFGDIPPGIILEKLQNLSKMTICGILRSVPRGRSDKEFLQIF